MTKPRFTRDDTEGYDDADLAALNAAWDQINSHGAIDENDPVGKSRQDYCAEQLLRAYDEGKRGGDLVAWYYEP